MQKKLLVLSALLLAVACDGGPGTIDARKFLAGTEGPKVPTVQDAMTESAKTAENKGDFRQAAQVYQQILEKHPDDQVTLQAYADSLRRSGENDRAIGLYDAMIAKDANNAAAKEGKGLALIAKNDFDTPAVLFDEVLKIDAKRWKTLNALGILFTTRNLHTEAQQYFTEALKYHADSPTILNNLGLSQALDRNFDSSIATLTKASNFAMTGSVERKRVDLNMALVYAIAGKQDEARAIAETYLTGAALNNNLGMYAHLAKDDQMARAYLNMALTDSKMFYEKAWDNLQDIGAGDVRPSAGKSRSKAKPKDPIEKAATTKIIPPDLFPTDIPATE